MANKKIVGLVWDDKYSITAEIDAQHKHLFSIINELIEIIDSPEAKEEEITRITEDLLSYKTVHFGTEEKYFHQFNFAGTAAHESAHKWFDQRVGELRKEHKGNARVFAFELVDFLEDWLIKHLMYMDQQYKKCFNEHGLY